MSDFQILGDDLLDLLSGVPGLGEEEEIRGRRAFGAGGASRQSPRALASGRGRSAGSADAPQSKHGGQADRPFGSARAGAAAAAAQGPQAAVVKLASFAAGSRRVGALTDYLSREGTLAVENQAGEVLLGREAIDRETSDWRSAFENRSPSKDVASLTITGVSGNEEDVTAALSQGFEGRRFAWQRDADEPRRIKAVVVLAAKDRRRLDVSASGRKAIIARMAVAGENEAEEPTVGLDSIGHGKNGLGYRLARLASKGAFHLGDGQDINSPAEASAVTREWAKTLNSRRIRDCMHLIVSARAGTELEAFRQSARAFLGEQFSGHSYLFAIHQDRDHLHAHAVITMRDELGQKLDPKIQDFADWREAFAAEARAHGIDMVATRRLQRAAAPAFRLSDVQLVDKANQRGVRPPERAMQRLIAKREDAIHVPSRAEGIRTVENARQRGGAGQTSDDCDRLEIAGIAGEFLAGLKAIGRKTSTEESTMRPVEDMQADFKAMNAAATKIALLLPAASRGRFHSLAAPILDNAASAITRAQERTVSPDKAAEAKAVAAEENREARDARRVADIARDAAIRGSFDAAPQTAGSGNEALARSAERAARRESQEANAANETARRVVAAEARAQTSDRSEPDFVRNLREEQARLIREQAGERARLRERERSAEDEA